MKDSNVQCSMKDFPPGRRRESCSDMVSLSSMRSVRGGGGSESEESLDFAMDSIFLREIWWVWGRRRLRWLVVRLERKG